MWFKKEKTHQDLVNELLSKKEDIYSKFRKLQSSRPIYYSSNWINRVSVSKQYVDNNKI
jgi:hypothetical protein